jgi:hypothetical protein
VVVDQEYKHTHTHKRRIFQGSEMGQLVAEETAKTGELQDARADEDLKQHEADGEMVLQQKRLSGAAAAAKKKKDQLMKKLQKKQKRKTVPYYTLYKYADWIDAVLMLVGSLAAVVNGLILPAMFLIQTKVINALGTLESQPNQLYSRISKVSMYEQMEFPGAKFFEPIINFFGFSRLFLILIWELFSKS